MSEPDPRVPSSVPCFAYLDTKARSEIDVWRDACTTYWLPTSPAWKSDNDI